jgi:hypothetical protein
MSEHKILFTGTMGAGKTTAIAAISEIAVVSTDVANQDKAEHAKAQTTVGMDYGEITLEGGDKVRLVGTPGQTRFDFMWKILARGALGVVILIDNSRPDPLADLAIYIDSFRDLIIQQGGVIGIGRTESAPLPAMDDYYQFLMEKDLVMPCFAVDVRRQNDVLVLIDALVSLLEAKSY